MTIRDLIDGGINLQGNIEIRAYCAKNNEYKDGKTISFTGGLKLRDVSAFADLEIKYMFSTNGRLRIELEVED